VESNDSKSSIRLIESKFNNRNNGTLERQQQTVNTISSSSSSPSQQQQQQHQNQQQQQNVITSSGDSKPPTGLQVLILWNNNLTSACSASAADLLECTEYLQIINFGHNPIGNEFLIDTKSSLKSNESLTSVGLQATNLSCDGLKVLGEILQFGGNSTLQRIDLRNNNVSVAGLTALSEALKSNKSIVRIDLDDLPIKSDEMLLPFSEYQRLVSTIRQQCQYNENPPEVQELPRATATNTVQRMKRTNNNFSTRKISLTCSSVIKTPPKSQQLLEPIKKQANNRLRSPSPTLSPSSPLTSPSRSRFQVSRVSESSSEF
jgi:protein phosphatase 1 regulatory subunit 37